MNCAPPMLIDEPKLAVCVASARNSAANAAACDSVESPARRNHTVLSTSRSMYCKEVLSVSVAAVRQTSAGKRSLYQFDLVLLQKSVSRIPTCRATCNPYISMPKAKESCRQQQKPKQLQVHQKRNCSSGHRHSYRTSSTSICRTRN